MSSGEPNTPMLPRLLSKMLSDAGGVDQDGLIVELMLQSEGAERLIEFLTACQDAWEYGYPANPEEGYLALVGYISEDT